MRQQIRNNFLNADDFHPVGLDFFYQGTENTVIAQSFGAKFGKKRRGAQIRHQFGKRRPFNGSYQNDFLNALFLKAFKSGAGLPYPYPFVRHVFSKNLFIGIGMNSQSIIWAIVRTAPVYQPLGQLAAAGNDAQFAVGIAGNVLFFRGYGFLHSHFPYQGLANLCFRYTIGQKNCKILKIIIDNYFF